MSYISVPSESAIKLKDLSGKTIYVYLLLRSLLRYKKGLKGKLVPITDIVKISYMDAENMGIDDNTFGRATTKLHEVGVIEIIPGKYGGRCPNKFRIK